MNDRTFYKFLWLGAFISIVLCVVMVLNLFRVRSQSENIETVEADVIATQVSELNRIISQKQNSISRLEEKALWNQQKDMMHFLTEQAQKVKVSIIGVEQMAERQVDSYNEVSVKLTLKGDYHTFGKFLNNLERSQDKVKLSYFSIKRHKSFSEYMIMELVLSVFRRFEVAEQEN